MTGAYQVCHMTRLTLLRFALAMLLVSAGCARHDNPGPPLATDKAITSFAFMADQHNPTLLDTITCDISGDTIYARTPAGTDVSGLVPRFTYEGVSISVDGVMQVSDTTAQDFSEPVTYTVTAEDKSQKDYIVKFLDTGLPAVYLSTGGTAITSKDDYIEGTMKIVKNFPAETLYEGPMKIKGRGNSTWQMPKKPYNIKLDDKAEILGMTKDKKWSLLANYGDKSLMRNAVAFELSRRLQLAFTPDSRFVDMYLNGVYQGNYQLTEKIEVSGHRVDVEEQTEGATTLPEISGGYLLEVDGYAYQEKVHFYTPRNMPVTVHYPDEDEITDAQKNYISQHFASFEDALFSADFTDPDKGYRHYLDLDSYINWYLVDEIAGNPDLFWSTYLYKKRNNDKLFAGPVWDFDLGFNADERLGDAVHKLMIDAGHEPKTWINQLMKDPYFRHAVRDRWNAVKADVATLPDFVDQVAAQLDYSQRLNFMLWDILSTKVHLNLEAAGSYEGEVAFLRNYLVDRIAWLDGQFNGSRFD